MMDKHLIISKAEMETKMKANENKLETMKDKIGYIDRQLKA